MTLYLWPVESAGSLYEGPKFKFAGHYSWGKVTIICARTPTSPSHIRWPKSIGKTCWFTDYLPLYSSDHVFCQFAGNPLFRVAGGVCSPPQPRLFT